MFPVCRVSHPWSYLCLSLVLFNRDSSPSGFLDTGSSIQRPNLSPGALLPDPLGNPGVYCLQPAHEAQSLSAMWVPFHDHPRTYFFHEGFAELWDSFTISLLWAFTKCLHKEKRSLISCIVALRQADVRKTSFHLTFSLALPEWTGFLTSSEGVQWVSFLLFF